MSAFHSCFHLYIYIQSSSHSMDNMGWDVSPVITNTQSWWSHQQHEIEEDDIFASIHDDVQRTDPSSHGDSNPERANFVPNLDLYSPQYQEAAMKLALDTMLANSQRGTSWGKGAAAELGSPPPPPPINRPQMIMSSLGRFMADFEVSPNAKGVSTTGSRDSLDCLLSATNSRTDNRSVEDDGISMSLSECKNLWNFGEYSETNLRNKDNYNKYHSNLQVHELDETVSQSSSTTKRSSDQSGTQLKVGENCSFNIHLFQSNCKTMAGGFGLIQENPPKPKKPRSERCPSSSNISFQQPSSSVSSSVEEPDSEAIAQMKEMIYRAAAFRPVNLGVEVVEKPKRKNVRISNDPQTTAARQRRERISERIRVLQRLVPGGSKMDTATMLDEAANYLKFLRSQVKALETLGHNKEEVELVNCPTPRTTFLSPSVSFSHPFPMQIPFPALQTSPSPIHQPKNCEG